MTQPTVQTIADPKLVGLAREVRITKVASLARHWRA